MGLRLLCRTFAGLSAGQNSASWRLATRTIACTILPKCSPQRFHRRACHKSILNWTPTLLLGVLTTARSDCLLLDPFAAATAAGPLSSSSPLQAQSANTVPTQLLPPQWEPSAQRGTSKYRNRAPPRPDACSHLRWQLCWTTPYSSASCSASLLRLGWACSPRASTRGSCRSRSRRGRG